ncbi:FG-GAP repeat protein [Grimontia marina]|uniref:FG-GAP repeat protein n=1 Tax=Grimontia marina TaxID=646534 RepID=UPI000786C645|nr:FG-GAP repeat protein [Grimontia marina]
MGALTDDAYPVTFSWSRAANATGYTLCRKDESQDDNCAKQGEPTTNTSLNLPLSLDTTADYFVLASNSTGKTASNEIAVSIPKPEMPVLATPQVGAFNVSSSSYPVTFSWDSAEYATHYTLCREDGSEDDNCQFLQQTEANNTSLTVNLNLDEPANYFVLASNGTGKTASVKQALSPAPGATNFSIGVGELENGYHPVTFNWEEADHATGYTLCRKNEALDDNCEKLGETNELSLTLSLGPLKNHLAEFFVLAENSTDKTASVAKSLERSDLTTLITYIKASNSEEDDYFAYSLSMSSDGNTVAVGAYQEDSSSREINSGESNNSASSAGAVYVYRFANGSWTQQAYIKALNADAGDRFGHSVSVSGDGNTLVVGAYGESSKATTINGDGNNNEAGYSGAAYVYRFDGSSWTQQAIIKASNADPGDSFGLVVSVSGDGNTLAVGAPFERSINTDESNNDSNSVGAAYVYRFENDKWTQQDYIKASNAGYRDFFGYALSVSGDGNTLAVGAKEEDSDADLTDPTGVTDSGAVYVYRSDGSNWSEEAYIKASNAESEDNFGWSVSVSEDGNTLAVAAYFEDSGSQGFNTDGSGTSVINSGAVYVYRLENENDEWSQQAYIKASNTGLYDYFGYALSVSGDGNALAVGARGEGSDATSINGDGDNDNAGDAGAVYIY